MRERARGRPAVRRRPLEQQAIQTIQKYGMIDPADRVLVAVSGGADSTALLVCLHQLAPGFRITLAAAHLNHKIRGAESDADEEFVRRLCERLQVPLLASSADVQTSARARRRNLEEAARDARYSFLHAAAMETGSERVALGHNLNDQAETVLMRLLRGSGPEGLSSIHPVRDHLFIRPLLECTRDQIVDYLQCQGVACHEDSTNRDIRYRRNRVRHELLPYLEQNFNPGVVRTLARTASIAREISDYMAAQTRIALEQLRAGPGGGHMLSVDGLLRLHPAIRRLVLRSTLKEFRGTLRGVVERHIEDLQRLCRRGRSGRMVQLPGGGRVLREFDQLVFVGEESAPKPYSYEISIPGDCVVPEAGVRVRARLVAIPDQDSTLDFPERRAYFDADTVPDTLVVRPRLPGDRLGSKGRKVKKMMIDGGIPLRCRATLPIVAARGVVIWVPGFRIARAQALRPDSRRCLLMEIEPVKSL